MKCFTFLPMHAHLLRVLLLSCSKLTADVLFISPIQDDDQ